MKKIIKENWFKFSISFSLVLFAMSMTYYFSYLPFKKSQDLNECLADSANNLSQQQIQIDSKIAELEKQHDKAQSEADNKLQEFLRSNPEPPADNFSNVSGTSRIKAALNGEHYQWQEKRNSIFNLANNLNQQIRDLEKKRDYELQEQKKTDNDECYLKYK